MLVLYSGRFVVSQNVPAYEISALSDLYQSADGDSWSWNQPGNKWNFTDADPCLDSWQGVTCSNNDTASTLHVLGLQLPNFHLVGYIPASLGNLTFLQALDLSRNSLDSTIPITLGDLAKLTSLNLATNVLTGTIPPSLGRCVELLDLNLATNLLTGSIPTTLGQCTQLT
jgi:hypothetical protein